MGKFTFTHADEGDTISFELNGVFTHPELTQKFVDFLRACGYVLPGDEFVGLEFADERDENADVD